MSDKLRFGEILVRAGVLDRSQLESVVREQDASGGDLGELLVARGCLEEATMLQTVSKALSRPIVSLETITPDPRATSLLTAQTCREHLLFPVEIERNRSGDHLHVAMANPLDVKAIKVVMQQARLRIQPLVASAREIKATIARHYGGPPPPVVSRQPMVAPSAASSPSLGGRPPAAPLSRALAAPPPVAGAPLPRIGPPVSAGGAEAVFDFAVMDLSSYDDGPPVAAAKPTAVPSPPRQTAGLDADLMALLEQGTAELSRGSEPPTRPVPRPSPQRTPRDLHDSQAPGSAYGIVQGRRREPSEPSLSGLRSELPSRHPIEPQGPPRSALPPLPSLPGRAQAGPVVSTSAGGMPPLPGPPRPLLPVASSPRPSALPPEPMPGMVDAEPLELRRLLDRYAHELDDKTENADETISHLLDRLGPARARRSTDQVFQELERSLAETAPGTSRLLLVLVRHLARRGLVDLSELLTELANQENFSPRRP